MKATEGHEAIRKVSMVERKNRRRSVAQILREAYRLHLRDRHTRVALKRCLG
jgi:hypothetical protein